MSVQTRIEEIKNEGYSFDFGEVFNQSIEHFKKIALMAGIVFILLTLISGAFVFGIMAVGFGISGFTDTMTGFAMGSFSTVGMVAYMVVVVIISGLMAPIHAGLLNMVYLAAHGRDFSISTVFGYYQTKYFKELFLVAVLRTLLNTVISFALLSTGVQFVGMLFTYLLMFFLMLSTPLIIFGECKAIESIKLSFMIVARQFFVLLALVIVSLIICCLGFIGLCIGIFFTAPFIYATIYAIYDHIVGTDGADELDEIGTSIE
jgi:hypothetical protein